jgi:glycosyltransferase involved in cell wall biosynthesis
MSALRVITIENENFAKHQIGGISTYIKAITKLGAKDDIEILCIGHGFSSFHFENIHYISTGTGYISNLGFFIGLFWKNFRKYLVKDTIVHVHHPYMCIPFLRYRKKIKLVLTLHSRQDESYKEKANKFSLMIYKQLNTYAIKKYNLILAGNVPLLHHYQSRYSIENIPVKMLTAPVDSDVFKPMDKIKAKEQFIGYKGKNKIILYVGRLEKVKNLFLLLDAFRLLTDKVSDTHLLIVGEGSEKQPLVRYIKEKSINNIEFFDVKPQTDLAVIMNTADVLVVSSIHESGPLVAKEALLCNLPVVSTDVGDIKEIIKDLPACCISSDDAENLAECINWSLQDTSERLLRTSVLKYDQYEFCKLLKEAYNSIL